MASLGLECGAVRRELLVVLTAIGLAAAGCGAEPGEPPWSAERFDVKTLCGGGTYVKGIDVSKYQSTVAWNKVKAAGVSFAVARVSDGTGYLDQYFSQNWKGMRTAGLLRGAYQYFRPAQDALAQATLFVKRINAAGGMRDGDLPCVLDLETSGGLSSSGVLRAVATWIAYVEKHTNRRPIIYTGSYFWDEHKLGSGYAGYPLWTAHYTSASCPLVPNAWSRWTIWQYTSSASVSGVTGRVDANRFNGTLSQLKAFAAASVLRRPDSGVATSDGGAAAADGGVDARGGDGSAGARPGDGTSRGFADGWEPPGGPATAGGSPGRRQALLGGCGVGDAAAGPRSAPLLFGLVLLAWWGQRRRRAAGRSRAARSARR